MALALHRLSSATTHVAAPASEKQDDLDQSRMWGVIVIVSGTLVNIETRFRMLDVRYLLWIMGRALAYTVSHNREHFWLSMYECRQAGTSLSILRMFSVQNKPGLRKMFMRSASRDGTRRVSSATERGLLANICCSRLKHRCVAE